MIEASLAIFGAEFASVNPFTRGERTMSLLRLAVFALCVLLVAAVAPSDFLISSLPAYVDT